MIATRVVPLSLISGSKLRGKIKWRKLGLLRDEQGPDFLGAEGQPEGSPKGGQLPGATRLKDMPRCSGPLSSLAKQETQVPGFELPQRLGKFGSYSLLG